MTKVKLITLDPTFLKWKTQKAKLAEVTAALNTVRGASFTIDVEYLALKPVVESGYVTHSYMDTISKVYYDAGYDFVAIHFGSKQWKQYKLKERLRGLYQRDNDNVYELYFWSDEKTLREGYNQFVQTFLHEMSHALAKGQNVADNTHQYHDTNKDIKGIFKTYTMEKIQTKESLLKSLWAKVAELTSQLAAVTVPTKSNGLLPLVQRQADKVLSEMSMLGYEMRITQSYRSIEEQNRLYAQGRTTAGKIVTNARGGESLHNYKVAADFVFRKQGYDVPESVWQTFGIIGEKRGFSWGGRWASFKDRPHLEMTLGHSLKDFREGKVDYTKFN